MGMFAWNQLLRITTTRSLYLLGAGASEPEIGRGAQLPNEIRRKFWANGVFPASVQPTSPLKSAILKADTAFQQDDCFIAQRELDALTPPEFVEVVIAQLLTRKDRVFPEQYRVFDLFYPSVIFNFNVDNLADQIHWKHDIDYPHLKIAPVVAHAIFMQKAVNWLAIPIHVAEYFQYWRPVPESPSITSTEPYRDSYCRLKDVFPTIRHVCLIGYSFGAWGEGIDDAESFEMITDLLRWKPKPVLVVNPAPHGLIDLLEGSIKQRVFGLSCKWNVLAKFMATGLFRKAYMSSAGSIKRFTDCFLWFDEIVSESGERKLAVGDLMLRRVWRRYFQRTFNGLIT